MLLVCVLAVLGYVAAEDVLQGALSSPQKMAALFSSYQVQNNKHYVGREAGLRMRLFQKNIRYVVGQNSQHLTWASTINKFSDKTQSERSAYLGKAANRTRDIVREEPVLSSVGIPSSVNWIEKGQVTAVKDQGSCGSCWSFGAMGTLESHYQQEAGVLRAFSEQDVLDCTYKYSDGCNGGLEWDAIEGIKNRGNELFSQSDYPYKAYDGSCRSKRGRNALKAAKVLKYTYVAQGETAAVAAMAKGAVAVSIEVISSFYSYTSGIYADNYRSTSPNHVLTGVGYTPSYIIVKNSWGADWGAEGFIKVGRNWNGCAFHRDTGYPALTSTGVDGGAADAAATYDPEGGNDDGGDDDGDCPRGTIRCNDGICRHQHMC